MEQRVLGKTNEKLSILGFGGIMVSHETQIHAYSLVSEAIDKGINYFDVAPTYANAQERLGPAIEPYRNKIFLACKTAQRTKIEAEKELYESLRKLRNRGY